MLVLVACGGGGGGGGSNSGGDNSSDFAVANDAVSLAEDGRANIDVLSNDSAVADPTRLRVSSPPASGTVSVDASSGQLIYEPEADFFGTDRFEYSVESADGTESGTAAVIVEVASVNDRPSFTAGADVTVTQDSGAYAETAWATRITEGADNETQQSLAFSVENDNTALFAVQPAIDASGRLSFTPATAAAGTATVRATLSDDGGTARGGADTSTASTFQITISPTDAAPSVNGDVLEIDEDAAATRVDVLANDSFGADGAASVGIRISTPPGHGTATVDDASSAGDPTDDTILYEPGPDYSGQDSFAYTIADADGDESSAVVAVTVIAVNDPPSPQADRYALDEDSGAATLDVIANDSFGTDGPGDSPVTVTAQPSHGTVSVDDGGSPASPSDDSLVYTPEANYSGDDSFQYSIQDREGDTAAATVTVTVAPVDDPPSASDDAVTVQENAAPTPISVLDNDSFGPDGPGTTSVMLRSQPGNGSATVDEGGTPDDPTDDVIAYSPDANFGGNDAFSYVIADAEGDTDSAYVRVTVDYVDSGTPTAADDAMTVDVNSTSNALDVLANDDFGPDTADNAPIQLVSAPANGTASIDTSGTPGDPTDDRILYTPYDGVSGSDTLSYRIVDADGSNDTATVSLTVTALNSAPTFTPGDGVSVADDAGTQSIANWATDISAGPSDESGQSLTFDVTNDNGALFAEQPSIDTNGTLSFAPTPDSTGAATVTVVLRDDGGTADGGDDTSDPETFTITVRRGNDVIVTFPTDGAFVGDSPTIAVSGRLEGSPDGVVDLGDVEYVDVNDRPATRESATPAFWTLRDLTLTPVELNQLNVSAQFSSGGLTTATQGVQTDLLAANAYGLAVDPNAPRAFTIAAGGIVEIDLNDGSRALISSSSAGIGTGVSMVGRGAVAVDQTRNRLLVVDSDVLLAVDPSTGNRTVVSAAAVDAPDGVAVGAGPEFGNPVDVVVGPSGAAAYVLDGKYEQGLEAVFEVDLATGDRNILSDSNTGTGVALDYPVSMDLDAANRRLVISDRGLNAVMGVDLDTGNRLQVAGIGGQQESIAVDAANGRALVIVNDDTIDSYDDEPVDILYAIDLVTGSRSVVSDPTTGFQEVGTGPEFLEPLSIAVDATRGRLLVTRMARPDADDTDVLTVDPRTGDRALLHTVSVGSGPQMGRGGHPIRPDFDEQRLVVLGGSGVYEVSTENGDRSLLAPDYLGVGYETNFRQANALAFDSEGNRAFVSTDDGRVVSLDLDSGARSLVLGNGVGSGVSMNDLVAVAYEQSRDRLIVIDENSAEYSVGQRVVAVDLASGERTVLSDSVSNIGADIEDTVALVVDEQNDRVLLVDRSLAALMAVDLTTGVRSIISTSANNDFQHFAVNGLTIDHEGNRALVSDWQKEQIIAVDLSNGSRTAVAGRDIGRGVALDSPAHLAWDALNRRLFLTTGWNPMVINFAPGASRDRAEFTR